MQVNNGQIIDGQIAFERGNYNVLMQDCPAYQKCKFIKVNNNLTSSVLIQCLRK